MHHGISILLADDSTPVRRAMRSYLEAVGFKVSEAADGVEAVERAAWLNPDVVVLDLAMPRMNGFEAARQLHGMDPKIHLILFTLYRDMIDRPEAPQVGIEAVVSKSDGLDALVRGISNILNPKWS